MNLGTITDDDETDAVHVMPVGDGREHMSSSACWCAPVPDAEDPLVIVHNSADGREHCEGHRTLH